MSDYVAKLSALLTVEAPNLSSNLNTYCANVKSFTQTAQRDFESIKGPVGLDSSFARLSSLLATARADVEKTVRAGREVSPSLQDRVGRITDAFVSLTDKYNAPGAYAGPARELQNYVQQNAIPDQPATSKDQYAFHQRLQGLNDRILRAKEQEATEAERAARAEYSAHTRLNKFMGQAREAGIMAGVPGDADRYQQYLQTFANRPAVTTSDWRASHWGSTSDWRQAHVGQQSDWRAPFYGATSDWRQSHYGRSSSTDWRQSHYGAYSDFTPGQAGPRGTRTSSGAWVGAGGWTEGATSDWRQPHYGQTSDWRTPYYGAQSNWMNGQAADPNARRYGAYSDFQPGQVGPRGVAVANGAYLNNNPAGWVDGATSDWRAAHYGRQSGVNARFEGAYSDYTPGQRGARGARTAGGAYVDPHHQMNSNWLRNANFAGQQAAYGIDDALQSYQFGGASASIRAASNNLTAIAGTAISPRYAVPAVVGLSMATAFASQAARNVGNDSPWAQLGKEQWSTAPGDPLKGKGAWAYMAEGYSRTRDQINYNLGTEGYDIRFGGDRTSIRERAKTELIRTERRDFEMKRVGFDMEQGGYDTIRSATSYDKRIGVVRSNEDAVDGIRARMRQTSLDMSSARSSGDTQLADTLEANLRKYQLELEVKQKILDVSKQDLALLRNKADALRDTDIRTKSTADLSADRFSSREMSLNDRMTSFQTQAAAEKAAIRALKLPPREEEDRLRAIDDRLAGELGNKALLEQQQQRHRANVARSADTNLYRGTAFDSINQRAREFRNDLARDKSLDPDWVLDTQYKSKAQEKKDRADYLYSQRQSWKVKDPSWTALNDNMDAYGERLREIEESKSMTPDERRRQMKAAKQSFDAANVEANRPSGQRKFSTEGYNKNSREDVELQAFMMRAKPIDSTQKQNEQELHAAVTESNRLLDRIDMHIQALGIERNA